MTSRINNKRIAKNTLFLYIRMLLIMGVSLYTVRALLELLGVVDFGIYNVVGGLVAMFTFLNGTLSTSSQRFFSIELAKADVNSLNKLFSLNLTVFLILIFVVIVLAESIGLWFLNFKLVIPSERLFAANVVYQLSILAFALQLISVPYNALIVAHERMSAFAYIGIIEAFLKLFVVFILTIANTDKLVIYGILMFSVAFVVTSTYILYCYFNFKESKYHLYWNKKEVWKIMSFSGWHFIGTTSVVVNSQGVNLLINLFTNPAVNAARAVAFQINSAVSQLSNNFFTAVKPQIYKSYSQGKLEELYQLIMRSTIMCVFLVSILIFPIISDTPFLLSLWLKDVPNHTVLFTQLVLVNCLIDSTNGPVIASALATDKIRRYELIVCFFMLLNFPLSYLVLLLGLFPEFTVGISIFISVINVFVRSYLLREMINFPFFPYVRLILKILFVSLLIGTILMLLPVVSSNRFLQFCFYLGTSTLLHFLLYYLLVLDIDERQALKKVVIF